MGACDMMGGGIGIGVVIVLYSLGPGTLIGLGMACKNYIHGNTKQGHQWAVSAVPLIGPFIAVRM